VSSKNTLDDRFEALQGPGVVVNNLCLVVVDADVDGLAEEGVLLKLSDLLGSERATLTHVSQFRSLSMTSAPTNTHLHPERVLRPLGQLVVVGRVGGGEVTLGVDVSVDKLSHTFRESHLAQIDVAYNVVRAAAAAGKVVVDELNGLDMREVVANVVKKRSDNGLVRLAWSIELVKQEAVGKPLELLTSLDCELSALECMFLVPLLANWPNNDRDCRNSRAERPSAPRCSRTLRFPGQAWQKSRQPWRRSETWWSPGENRAGTRKKATTDGVGDENKNFR
jgi:hypothetical protein